MFYSWRNIHISQDLTVCLIFMAPCSAQRMSSVFNTLLINHSLAVVCKTEFLTLQCMSIFSYPILSYSISPHLTTPYLLSSHLISPHLISSHITSSHQISSHIISPHLISSHLTSSHQISSHIISPHLISSHLTSPHLISPHLTSPHLISSHLILSTLILKLRKFRDLLMSPGTEFQVGSLRSSLVAPRQIRALNFRWRSYRSK